MYFTRFAPFALLLAGMACGGDPPSAPTASIQSGVHLAVSGGDVPRLQLILDSREPTPYLDGFGNPYLRFELSIRNSGDVPDALFAASPQLPPCGLNASASRTWVYVEDGDGNILQAFCGFDSAANLDQAWFAIPVGGTPPKHVRMTLWDRLTDQRYTSTRIRIP